MRAATARASSAICLHKVAEYDSHAPLRDGTSRKRNHDHRIHRGVSAAELAPPPPPERRGGGAIAPVRGFPCLAPRLSGEPARQPSGAWPAVARLSVCSAHVRVSAADLPMRLLGDAWSKNGGALRHRQVWGGNVQESRQRDQRPHCCGAQRRRTIIRLQVRFCSAAFTKAGHRGYSLVTTPLREPQSLGSRKRRPHPAIKAGCCRFCGSGAPQWQRSARWAGFGLAPPAPRFGVFMARRPQAQTLPPTTASPVLTRDRAGPRRAGDETLGSVRSRERHSPPPGASIKGMTCEEPPLRHMPQVHSRPGERRPLYSPTAWLCGIGWAARRIAHSVRSRFSSPAFALATIPWKYPLRGARVPLWTNGTSRNERGPLDADRGFFLHAD